MAEALEEYFVSEDCIACDACCDEFPDIFTMNAEHTRAKAVNKAPVGTHNPWDIVNVCPVEAISLTNMPMPEKPEGEGPGEEESAPLVVGDWKKRWEAVKDQDEDQWERMKRYGLASSMTDEGDHYLLTFDMPAKVPNHKLKFKWGLPDVMPDYSYQVDIIDEKRVRVRAKLQDERIKKLSGWINSFPMGFLRELVFEEPIVSHKESYDPETKILEVKLQKAVRQESAA